MPSRRFGFITPAEMLAGCLRGDSIRFFVLAFGLVFAGHFLGRLLAG